MLMAVKKAKEASFKKGQCVCYFPECYPESEEHRPS